MVPESRDLVLSLPPLPEAPSSDTLGLVQVVSAVAGIGVLMSGTSEGWLPSGAAVALISLIGLEVVAVGRLRAQQEQRAWQGWAREFARWRQAVVALLARLFDDEQYELGLAEGQRVLEACPNVPRMPADVGYRGLCHASRVLHWIADSVDQECPRFSEALRGVAAQHEAEMACTDG